MRFGGIFAGAAAGVAASAAAAADAEPICADRPGLATGTCTVAAGMVQVETGFFEWARDRSGELRTEELTVGETALVFGVTDRFHVGIDLMPYMRTRERDGDGRARASGFGDVGIRAKYRLTRDGAPVELALNPFVTIPTAKRPLGSGKVEGGMIVPVEWAIPRSSLSLTFSPELGLVADADGSGHHLAIAKAVSLEAALSSRLAIAFDLWGQWDRDPDGTVRRYAVGPSAAYLISTDVQIDAGVDFGLNRHTSDVTVYSGIAARF